MKDYEWNEDFGSQKANVRAWLLDGRSITPLEALNNFGSLRLSAIIFRLREEGLPVEMERLQVSPKKRVARYYIKPENLK